MNLQVFTTCRSIIKELNFIISARFLRNVSVIFFDIDDFKSINDTYGHHAGDIILANIGKILLQNIRESDLAGRYGGDEFIVILQGTDLKQASFVVQNSVLNEARKKIKSRPNDKNFFQFWNRFVIGS